MAYADRPMLAQFDINTVDTAALLANDVDLKNVVIPAGREVEIQSFNIFVRQASNDATDSIELCKDDNTVLAQCFIGVAGAVAAYKADGVTLQTFPITVAPQSTTALKTLKLRVNGATDATTEFSAQFVITGL